MPLKKISTSFRRETSSDHPRPGVKYEVKKKINNSSFIFGSVVGVSSMVKLYADHIKKKTESIG